MKGCLVIALVFFCCLAILILLIFLGPFKGPVNEELSDNYYYHRYLPEIRYSSMGNWFELSNQKIECDRSSFEVLARDYAKDKSGLIYRYYRVAGNYDIPSLKVTHSHVILDKDHIYQFSGNDQKHEVVAIENSDPSSIEIIDYNWFKDQNQLYRNSKVTKLDHETFKVISGDYHSPYVKDKNGYYLNNDEQSVLNFPNKEGKVLTRDYLLIENTLYRYKAWHKKQPIDSVFSFNVKDAQSIEFKLDDEIMLIDDRIYVDDELIQDVNRFDVKFYTGDVYWQVDGVVYYRDMVIPEADPSTFQVFDDQYAVTKDAEKVFVWGKWKEGVNPSQLRSYKGYAYQDDNYIVYYDGSIESKDTIESNE